MASTLGLGSWKWFEGFHNATRFVSAQMGRLLGSVPDLEPTSADSGGDKAQPGKLSILQSSLALVAAKTANMGLGFIFWVLAARFFSTSEVGLTAAAVAGMMLCTQIGLLGLGSSFITEFSRHRHNPSNLLSTTFSLVSAASLLVGFAFLLVASLWFEHLRVIAVTPAYATLFLTMVVLGTNGIFFDQISAALRRGGQALTRNLVSQGVTLGHLIGIGVFLPGAGPMMIFSTWVTGGVATCGYGALQLVRNLPVTRIRPRIDQTIARRQIRVGIPNHLLTLFERAPGFILPIVVTELLSSSTNAYWYAAWMMAWVVYMMPIQIGMTLFAELAKHPEGLWRLVRHGIRSSLVIGSVCALGGVIAAPWILGILGPDYAAAATTPLRVLLLVTVPFTFVQAYFAVARATGRLREALMAGGVSSVVGIVLAGAAGVSYGLTAMAVAWMGTQFLAGAFALIRLRSLARRPSTVGVAV
ncbi:MAG: oligosaccharide flippase family protein [Actinobacteria bacterium]|nr:oligosaccharide flippase family protein [Actinomycetota bacterium]